MSRGREAAIMSGCFRECQHPSEHGDGMTSLDTAVPFFENKSITILRFTSGTSMLYPFGCLCKLSDIFPGGTWHAKIDHGIHVAHFNVPESDPYSSHEDAVRTGIAWMYRRDLANLLRADLSSEKETASFSERFVWSYKFAVQAKVLDFQDALLDHIASWLHGDGDRVLQGERLCKLANATEWDRLGLSVRPLKPLEEIVCDFGITHLKCHSAGFENSVPEFFMHHLAMRAVSTGIFVVDHQDCLG